MEQYKEFLRSVLPDEGMPCIALKHRDWKGFKHRVFAGGVADLEANVGRWIATAEKEGIDMYFCISSLVATEHEAKNARGDSKKQVRVQENCLATRVFVLDIDVKQDVPGFYPNKQAAATALRELNKVLGFPQPTVVNSGGGLHVYWHFTEAVPCKEWRQYAVALKKILIHVDPIVAVDTARVADSAGVLRIPDTFNFKIEDRPRPVSVIRLSQENQTFQWYRERIDALLFQFDLGLPPAVKAKVPTRVSIDMPASPAVPLEVLKDRCDWTHAYFENKGDASEPEWYAMLGLADYTSLPDGRTGAAVALAMSEGHSGFTEDGALAKYEQVQLRQTGPTLCARFTAINSARCAGCPWVGKLSTPLQLTAVDLEAPPPVAVYQSETGQEEIAVPAPPEPYFRGENGGIYVRLRAEDGAIKPRKIYEYDVFPVRRVREEDTGSESIELSLTLPYDGTQFVRIPTGMLLDDRRFAVSLADRGIITNTKNMKLLCDYLISYTQLLQRTEAAQEEFSRFGWRGMDGATPKFVVSGEYIDHHGDTCKANVSGSLRIVSDAASCKGEVSEWAKAFDVYRDMEGAEPYILAAMLGFASPLMPLLDQSGLIYNMLGPSGTGKSTSLELATSIWGKPNSQHAQVHDNRIPMLNTLGSFQNIPMAFDEVTNMEANELSEIAYAVSQGRGKNRADRSGKTRQNVTTWNTFVISTSNYSLYDKLASASVGNNAHAYRIFEVSCPPAHPENQRNVHSAMATIRENYGQAGRLFMQYVITHMDSVRSVLTATYHAIIKKYHMATAERFWAALLACVSVGGAISKKIGLHTYDLPKLIQWAAAQLTSVRESVTNVEGDAISVVADFFQNAIRSTLRVVDGAVSLAGVSAGVGNELKIRVEFKGQQPDVAYLSCPALRKYCTLNKVEYSWLIAKLKTANLVTDDNRMRRLATGTSWTIPPVRCVMLDLQKIDSDVFIPQERIDDQAQKEGKPPRKQARSQAAAD